MVQWIDLFDYQAPAPTQIRVTSFPLPPVPTGRLWYIERVECRLDVPNTQLDTATADWLLFVLPTGASGLEQHDITNPDPIFHRDAAGPSSAGAFLEDPPIRLTAGQQLGVNAQGIQPTGTPIAVHIQGYDVDEREEAMGP